MKDLILILPELILTLTLIFVVIAEITYHDEQMRLVNGIAMLGLAAAFLQTLVTYRIGPAEVFGRTLSIDGLSLFFKLFFIALAGFAIAASSHTREIPQGRRTEYAALTLAATLAMCLAAAASDLLLIFLAVQLINIMSYFIAGYGKRSTASVEAGVKYMIFSSVAGMILLYGFATLFSTTHSLNIYETHQMLLGNQLSHLGTLVVFILIFMALCFQIGAFPMYLWTPDVLEGAPTPASAFLSVGTRAVGFAIAVRFLIVVFAQPAISPGQWQVLGNLEWTRILGVVAGLTMMVGSFLALRQKAAKRLVACLVIVQSGFLLMGILVLDQVGVAALLYNLVIELFALMGIFYVLAFFYEEVHSDRLEDLKGFLGRAVPECICLVLFLLCLAGVPPAPGFIGKFTLIGAAVRHQWWGLATLSILATTVSTVAIARLAFHLIGDLNTLGAVRVSSNPQRKLFLTAVFVPMLLVGLFADQVLDWAGKSLGFILW